MSHEATSLVKSRAFGSVTRKAIALVLADYCDAAWSCFVGQERLAWESETSDRTARRTLADFEAEKLIERQHRYDDTGRRTSDRIVLVPSVIRSLPARVSGELADTDEPLPATERTTTGQSLAGEPPEEPSESNQQSLPVPSVDELFAEWYQVYPLHKGRGAAVKAYRAALKKTDAITLLRKAAEYRDDPDRSVKYTAYPATWLNQDRWADEPTAIPTRNGQRERPPIMGDETRDQPSSVRTW